MTKKVVTDAQPRVRFDCTKCPAFCCSVYERVQVTKRDINRLAKYFGLTVDATIRRHTKMHSGERVLRRKADELFGEACKFIDPKTRGCSIYHGRPAICREYPGQTRCSYYDVLQFERAQQDDPNVLPLFQITFREWKKSDPVEDGGKVDDKGEKVAEWIPKKG